MVMYENNPDLYNNASDFAQFLYQLLLLVFRKQQVLDLTLWDDLHFRSLQWPNEEV